MAEQAVNESNKIAVISGRAFGIGKGIAIQCPSLSFNTIILIDINSQKL